MKKATRKRASTPVYVSPKQLTIDAFESPFSQQLKSDNRWVVLANLISWDEICGTYLKHVGTSSTGRPPLSPRVVLGSLIIKHITNLADKIYCTRSNRLALKEKGIKLLAKPLGRPSALHNHVSPGERNPIEGKFGQAKTAYGLNRIKARLRTTSESWIASINLVLNLIKLAVVALPCIIFEIKNSFSAKAILKLVNRFADEIRQKLILGYDLLNPNHVLANKEI